MWWWLCFSNFLHNHHNNSNSSQLNYWLSEILSISCCWLWFYIIMGTMYVPLKEEQITKFPKTITKQCSLQTKILFLFIYLFLMWVFVSLSLWVFCCHFWIGIVDSLSAKEHLLLKLRHGPIDIMPVLQETSHYVFDVASDFF